MTGVDVDIPVAYGSPIPLSPTTAAPAPLAPPPPVAAGFVLGGSGGGGSFVLPDPARSPSDVSPEQIACLREQGFTEGLARALAASAATFPLRIWVVDNSGSMSAVDGHRIVETSKRNDVRVVECTRWREIQETIEYHAQMAALLRAPTIFRLLNDPGARVGPAQFGVADKGDAYIEQDLQVAMDVMKKAAPGGVTPLARHVREIRHDIGALAPTLSRRGQKVAVVLATDGLPTDENGVCNDYYKRDFVDAIRGLEGLPVWVVVRLCTDDEAVVDFYNELDAQLELSVEVLDDFVGEAIEVHDYNPWLNYCLPLHRCREMGFHHRIMDLLDERPLTKGELAEFCRLLLGEGQFDGVLDPEVDMKGFLGAVDRALGKEKSQWNPAKKRVMPCIDVKKMRRQYGEKHRWGLSCNVDSWLCL